MNNHPIIVDTILLALDTGIKTESEAVEECGDLAKHGLLDFQYLQYKNQTLYQKVMEWCERHPPEL
jgi:hypothetical protein